ncbi:ZZ-type zinc finger-containing protein 3 [Odontomachus brunneus]|uniref:ZZ-type zinc finger-containing protein 3 n=1 Tax=Odontomachus brunneus TaxID=486640 RepID=UPI0013F26C14|nr:ZZ-type zinc finger-containing protein 3 [Odontomachus brunneus]
MNDEEMKCSDEENEFYFESDHLALKGNKDYCEFVKTIVILEAQRTQAIQDLDKLMSIQSKAINDPISFVAQLQTGDLPELPGLQKIAEIPYINWSQYKIAIPDIRMRPQTRHGNVISQTHIKNEEENGKILVRGRAFDATKPETFNQLWTFEEQKRLEELLIEYPPEDVEMRRWTKIAKALGNRTPKQVSSRVQKYFIKLLRAGLPIPGRGPKVKIDFRKSLTHKQRNNNFLMKRSTFFPHQDISFDTFDENKKQSVAEEYGEDIINEKTVDISELKPRDFSHLLKTEEKEDPSTHKNEYKCTICNELIRSTRWHCTVCHDKIDLCGNCAVARIENHTHNPYHKLIPIIKSPPYTKSYDIDYLPQSFNNCDNYLDPNFMPE